MFSPGKKKEHLDTNLPSKAYWLCHSKSAARSEGGRCLQDTQSIITANDISDVNDNF